MPAKKTKYLSLLFLLLLALITAGALVRAVLFPREINYYENRSAYLLPTFSVTGFIDKEFQAGMDDALGDQLPLSSYIKAAYNNVNSRFLCACIERLSEKNPDGAWSVGEGMYCYRGKLLYEQQDFDELKDSYGRFIQGVNRAAMASPELDFYILHVETDRSFNPVTNTHSDSFSYLLRHSDLPRSHLSRFYTESFEQYDDYFFGTDHHWNNRGAYEAYAQCARMLGVGDDELIRPVSEETLPYRFSGTKSAGCGLTTLSETPSAYIFDNAQLASFCPDEAAFFSGDAESYSYSRFFGADAGELIFDTGNTDRGNLLVIGNSFDNAIIELLACHFNVTCNVDLRWLGAGFKVSEYARTHDIDKVLFVCDETMYLDDRYCVEE